MLDSINFSFNLEIITFGHNQLTHSPYQFNNFVFKQGSAEAAGQPIAQVGSQESSV